MNSNQVFTCKDCGAEFSIDKKEADWYAKKHWDIPKRCKECREKRKANRERKE